jgi:RNA polymerase sigma-70 factor (ECF subfamily)
MPQDPDAEDVVQQALIKAFHRLRQFRFEASFRTWVLQIATREVLQWRRRRRRWQAELLPVDGPEVRQLPAGDGAFSFHQESERQEARRLIDQALARMSAGYRVMVQLRDLEEFSISETARRLCMSIPAVKSRHRRARLQMARLLTAPRRAPA